MGRMALTKRTKWHRCYVVINTRHGVGIFHNEKHFLMRRDGAWYTVSQYVLDTEPVLAGKTGITPASEAEIVLLPTDTMQNMNAQTLHFKVTTGERSPWFDALKMLKINICSSLAELREGAPLPPPSAPPPPQDWEERASDMALKAMV